jgi:CxxC motif-containing protein (DUF1111 family)
MLNTVPSFIKPKGPVRQARFVRAPDGTPDGGVHQLFAVTGHMDAPPGCNIAQEDFETQLAQGNVSFRIPTPAFGGGLIEAIAESDIVANLQAHSVEKGRLGIRGRANRLRTGHAHGNSPRLNRSGNHGTPTKFGWKAQDPSLAIIAAEAYNVEQGVTNPLFPTETDETPDCATTNGAPDDQTNFDADNPGKTLSDMMRFTHLCAFPHSPLPPLIPT